MTEGNCEWNGCDEGATHRMRFEDPSETVAYCDLHRSRAMAKFEYESVKPL